MALCDCPNCSSLCMIEPTGRMQGHHFRVVINIICFPPFPSWQSQVIFYEFFHQLYLKAINGRMVKIEFGYRNLKTWWVSEFKVHSPRQGTIKSMVALLKALYLPVRMIFLSCLQLFSMKFCWYFHNWYLGCSICSGQKWEAHGFPGCSFDFSFSFSLPLYFHQFSCIRNYTHTHTQNHTCTYKNMLIARNSRLILKNFCSSFLLLL